MLNTEELRTVADTLSRGLRQTDGRLHHQDGSPLSAHQLDVISRATRDDLIAAERLLVEDVLRCRVEYDAQLAFCDLMFPVMADGEGWHDAIHRLPPGDQRRAWDLAVASGYAEVA